MQKYKWYWVAGFIIISLVFGVMYKVGRINLDSTLHDPLTYEAVGKAWELASSKGSTGQLKANLPGKVNVANNLLSFVTIYDRDKKVVASSGDLDGAAPDLPMNFLDNTNQYVRNYFDWRPKDDVHLAGTTVAVGDDGYVLVGRNMQEADRQGNRLTKSVIIGWAVSVLLLTVGFIALKRPKR